MTVFCPICKRETKYLHHLETCLESHPNTITEYAKLLFKLEEENKK